MSIGRTVEEQLAIVIQNTEILTEQKGIDYDAGVAVGKAQRDYEWWDQYQSQYYGTVNQRERTNWLYTFAGHGWNDALYNPIRQINADAHSQSMYAFSAITDTKVPIRLTGGKTANRGQTFRDSALITIRKFIVDENTSMSAQFTNCTKLENLVIEGTIAKNAYFHWCPLTKASFLSVFAALSDTAAGVIAQFKTSAVNAAFETSEGANDGSTSAEWTALVTSKPNWTIALAEA